MKLTIESPDFVESLKDFPTGIMPLRKNHKYFLVIKGSKELILTAQTNKGFCFYLAPVEQNGTRTIGLITAFFDDKISPLILWTAIVKGDFSELLIPLLCLPEFEVYFFDEHDREHGSYRVRNPKFKQFGNVFSKINLLALTVAETLEINNKIGNWFRGTTSKDDRKSFPIYFEENLFPHDAVLLDLTDPVSLVTGAKSISVNSLERKEPGDYQEADIVRLLLRIFRSEQIFLNPFKQSDHKELVDVLVVGDQHALFIQAKDSPNTESILRNATSRKRAKSLSQLEEANGQLKGAISYAKKNPILQLNLKNLHRSISLQGLQIVGLAVIKELFEDVDTFEKYSELTLDLISQTGVPCVFLDYPDLHMYTRHTTDEMTFMGALQQLFEIGWTKKRFGRLQFGLPPGIKEKIAEARRSNLLEKRRAHDAS
ncbi:MAG: hypothetical protein V4542_04040 [Pseudomonadota bacterium]